MKAYVYDHDNELIATHEADTEDALIDLVVENHPHDSFSDFFFSPLRKEDA